MDRSKLVFRNYYTNDGGRRLSRRQVIPRSLVIAVAVFVSIGGTTWAVAADLHAGVQAPPNSPLNTIIDTHSNGFRLPVRHHGIRRSPSPTPVWSKADAAMREAMNKDPTYTSLGNAEALSQTNAISAWMTFLERKDSSDAQKAFAWWRIGSLYAYNFSSSHGEQSHPKNAEQAFKHVFRLLPDTVCFESLNSATVFGSLPGDASVCANRLAFAYKFIFSRSRIEIEGGARLVGANGFAGFDERYFPSIGKRTVEDRRALLQKLLGDSRNTITDEITTKIRYTQDPNAIDKMLKEISGVADPRQMEQWRKMEREVRRKLGRGRSRTVILLFCCLAWFSSLPWRLRVLVDEGPQLIRIRGNHLASKDLVEIVKTHNAQWGQTWTFDI